MFLGNSAPFFFIYLDMSLILLIFLYSQLAPRRFNHIIDMSPTNPSTNSPTRLPVHPPSAYQARHVYRLATRPLTTYPDEVHRVHIRVVHVYQPRTRPNAAFWTTAINTLHAELYGIHWDDIYKHPCYGGIIIGSRFRFFVYDYQTRDLRPFPGYPTTIFELPRDALIFEAMRAHMTMDHLGFWYRAVLWHEDVSDMGIP